MTDAEFLRLFETCELAPEHFDHRGHLRLAWLYLGTYPLEAAIDKTTSGIARYANSLGAKDKFQYKLTETVVIIMGERIGRQAPNSFAEFLSGNKDMVTNLKSVIAKHKGANSHE